MSYLMTCMYRQRLEAMGLSIDVIDFSSEVQDPQALQVIGKAVVEDV